MRRHVRGIGLVAPQPHHPQNRDERQRRDERADAALGNLGDGGDQDAGNEGFQREVEH